MLGRPKNGWLIGLRTAGRRAGWGDAGDGRVLGEWPPTDGPWCFPPPTKVNRHFYRHNKLSGVIYFDRKLRFCPSRGKRVVVKFPAGMRRRCFRQRWSVFRRVGGRCSQRWTSRVARVWANRWLISIINGACRAKKTVCLDGLPYSAWPLGLRFNS